MNIHAKRFDKVRYLDENGYDSDREHANKYLIRGNEYTVSEVIIGGYSSTVILLEFPRIHFNTVMFEDVKKEHLPLEEVVKAVMPEELNGIFEDQSSERNRISKSLHGLSNQFLNENRNPMTKPVFTKSKTESDWTKNLLIPHQTIDRHSVFDDHFKIIGFLDRGVRRTKSLKFNNFDWNQLFNRTVSKHTKYGKEVEYETYHILSYNGDKKFTIIAEKK